MDDSKPKLRGDVDFTELSLDPDTSQLLGLMDGRLSVSELAVLVGVSPARVALVVASLESQGALEAGEVREAPTAGLVLDDEPTDETSAPVETPPEAPAAAADDEPEPSAQAVAALGKKLASFRQLYETQLHHLPVDARVALAKQSEEEVLAALCLDPEPPVVRAVMENARAGLEHARLIAEHHRNPVGLEAVVARAELGRDAQVRRFLLRNNQASDIILRRILSPLPLAKLFQVNLSRENSERAKRLAREVFRQRWQQSQGEETAGLVFQTEGRCLLMLIGLHLDQAATAFLCRRTYTSSLLVQNLARFPTTPPGLIKHLFHQSIVRRAPHLKKLLTQHPNCPGEVKHAG
jgi:hypothetical protein